ncbi:MAG: FAD-dependent oxidoreductase, partial [Thiobacillus sp.]|nr:FAD-dependent oxidoreductase [Thiobacillus sp.]
MADIKVAAYICKGCGLGERLDADALVKVAQKDGKVPMAKSHDFLCNADGVAMIKNDIANEGVTHIMIGACSRRAKTEAFFFPENAVARANLREGVVWIRPDTEDARETTQEMAEDYIRMGCAEVKAMTAPTGNTVTGSSKTLLVVGGGVTGMTTAIEASKTGYPVVLVEKSGALGGWAAKLYKRVPVHEPYKSPADTGVGELVSQVLGDSNIKVYLNATVAKTDGAPGRFVVDIATESGATHTEDIGAIVQASGFTLYDMNKLPELGGGKSANVVDQAGLEALAIAAAAGDGVIRRPSDGQPVKSVVFVQCAGQRDPSGTHLAYCSGYCCNTSIKQAMYFKDANPSVDTTIIYSDLRTPGNGEDFYRSAQEKGVIFTKGKVAEVVPNGATSTVKFNDLILGDTDASILDVDLVVLATGQVPNSGINIEAPVAAAEEGVVEIKPISILNLTYRQGKDVPQLKQGFTDSHFICFPYETRRTG